MMKTSSALVKSLVVFGLLCSAESAWARQEPMTYAGVQLGVANPGFTGGQAQFAKGGTLGRRLTPDFGVGAYYGTSSQNMLGNTSATLSTYGVEGNYYFTGDMDGLSVGMKLGLATLKVSSVSTTPVSYGPRFGFDYRGTSALSLGFEANVLFQGAKDFMDGYSIVNLLGVVKFWF